MRRAEEGVVGGDRGLHLEHVDTGAGDLAVFQGGGQGGGVHHRAPGGVDEQGGGLHQLQLLLTDQADGGGRLRHMEGDNVALGQQLLQGVHKGDALHIFLGAAPGQHLTAEGVGDPGHPQADGAGAHDAEGLALQLKAHQAGLGAPLAAGGVAGENVPGQGHGEAEDQVSYRHSGVAGAVADGDAVLVAVVHVHMVGAGEGHADHLQVGALADDALPVGEVGENDDVGVLAALHQSGLILLTVGIGNQLHALAQGLPGHGEQGFVGDAQGLQEHNFHKYDLFFRQECALPVFFCHYTKKENIWKAVRAGIWQIPSGVLPHNRFLSIM